MNCLPGIRATSVSEISAGQLLLLAAEAADATMASEEGEVGMVGNMTAGYFADLSATSATSEDNVAAPPRLSRLRRKSFEADSARLSSTSSCESRSEGEVK